MPLQRPLHLDIEAVFRGEEVGTYQEQDDLSRFEVLIDLAGPLGAAGNPPVVPSIDSAAPKLAQVREKPRAQRLIFVGIRDEQVQARHRSALPRNGKRLALEDPHGNLLLT